MSFRIIALSGLLLSLLTLPDPQPIAQAAILSQEQSNCQATSNQDYVQLDQGGVVPLSLYCQAKARKDQSEKQRQIPSMPWGTPYSVNGNICRDRAGDQVCLNPNGAIHLKWIPLMR